MTDPTPLQESIAQAICDADEASGDNWEEDRWWYDQQAAAVLPILRAAQADAWDEAYGTGVSDWQTSLDFDGGRTAPARINPYRTTEETP